MEIKRINSIRVGYIDESEGWAVLITHTSSLGFHGFCIVDGEKRNVTIELTSIGRSREPLTLVSK